jgi:dipeptidyl aminopeptidase/acylaminoacyl peptidase
MESQYSITRYLNIRSAYFPRFFSDERHIAFLTNITGIPQIWRVEIDEKTNYVFWPEQLTFENERVQWLRCSPVQNDGTIIFGRDYGGNENAQIYLLENGLEKSLSSGHSNSMHIPGDWSKDAEKFIFSANRRDRRFYDLYIHTFKEEDKLIWRNDQPGYLANIRFSRNGKKVLFTRVQSSFKHQLFEIDIFTCEVREVSITDEDTRYITPYYTKDDESIYVVTDFESDYLYIACINLNSLKFETVTDQNWDVEWLTLSPNDRYLNYALNVEGVSELYLLDLENGEKLQADLGSEPGVCGKSSFSKDDSKLAFTYSNVKQPMNIHVWTIQIDNVFPVTKSSCGGLPYDSFIAPELVHYPTFDLDKNEKHRMIPAWLYKPRRNEKRVPVIFLIHGGPESQARPSFDYKIQYYLQNGYAVFQPNVRGSTGYGKFYSHLDDVRKRMDSVEDVAYGAYWMKKQEGFDSDRFVVMGGSYGGFMVLSALTTHPDIWIAGVDIVGISNLATFLKNTSEYRRKHREAEYGSIDEDLEFLESIAPINHIDRISSPLMVIQGRNDPRVPMSESEQMVKALKAIRKTVEFLVFDDEGHGVYRLKNKIITYPAILNFLEKHLSEPKQSS